jgi:hypothetical protein
MEDDAVTTDDTTVAPPVAEDNQDAINPAWNSLLEAMPTSLHSQIIPHLKAWDNNVQQLVGKVHSEYEPYKPFKEQSIDPVKLNEAYGVYEAMNQDPAAFIKAVSEYFNITPEQGQPPAVTNEEEVETDPLDIESHPEFQRVKGLAETMAQAEIQRAQLARQQEEDAALEAALKELKTKHGEFDEDYVISKAATGKVSLEDAVLAYNKTISDALAAHQAKMNGAPVVMGAGGGTPSTAIPVETLRDETARRKLVADLLAQAKQNGG